MSNETKRIIIGLAIFFIVIIAFRIVWNRTDKTDGYKATISGLEDENKRLAKLLADSEATVGRLTEQLEESQSRVTKISERIDQASEHLSTIESGTGDAIDAIDASIRITAELLNTIKDIEAAISP